MKKIQISTDRILLIIMVMLLWYTTLVKACENETAASLEPNITFTEDGISQVNMYYFGMKRKTIDETNTRYFSK